jgi:hypothetical protein
MSFEGQKFKGMQAIMTYLTEVRPLSCPYSPPPTLFPSSCFTRWCAVAGFEVPEGQPPRQEHRLPLHGQHGAGVHLRRPQGTGHTTRECADTKPNVHHFQIDDEPNAVKFSQVFNLMPVDATGSSFWIRNEVFTLNYG